MAHHKNVEFVPLNISVLTVSDTRTLETDTSGQALIDRLEAEGHKLADRAIVIDDVYKLRAKVSQWIADDNVQAILLTGGTGFTSRDNTPEAMIPLFDKQVEGFGELFRHVSYQQIGSSTVQSRALAGIANRTVIFCMPGSPNACKTAWDEIIKSQLDARHRPCNFVEMVALAPVDTACETRS
ncbi:molybdenum cofactor biosynthesis protein B [Motiliproteus sp. MSK22-1]|uniref:molybdenum cofactor biosynthesis protein B n=1 Tax=Motiliproteus sp. MSK22-1 TaxID=1897630 RepID=UPI0009784FA1|nr:molybdenum cofactor biosynthesis protein B [Motiliproteus sp. MSK22-1]OMH32053.1 molybdenum cofactor biosynthesis protein B [Motiliproteus sp. MSK22-1]